MRTRRGFKLDRLLEEILIRERGEQKGYETDWRRYYE